MTTKLETVHIIFKTHLDIGFTALARDVVTQYFNVFIPEAIKTAETLRQSGAKEQFIWTTGSWLIYEYLEKASPSQKRHLELAIEAGDIAWHGLPFTLHSELVDASLFKHGLTLARELDQRFGKQTIAAKMTDVPGHTRAMIPLLADHGIEFLHIGVNEACTPPDLPPVFVWRDENGAEIIVMYHNHYGGGMTVPGTTSAVFLAHSRDETGEQDNLGPHTPEQVKVIFQHTLEQFPDTNVVASTLDQYARELRMVKHTLPVVTSEIGDTWIHGVGSDPFKVGTFRTLARLRQQWIASNKVATDDRRLKDFSGFLLMVPEHTWGLDEKKYLHDYEHYSREQFETARKLSHFKVFEVSWGEQRAYLDKAVQALGQSSLADEAQAALKNAQPVVPNLEAFVAVTDATAHFETKHFVVGFDPTHGAISHLYGRKQGQLWATADQLLGLIQYQTFSQEDYDRFIRQYHRTTLDWGLLDFSKPGIASTGIESQWLYPTLSDVHFKQENHGVRFVLDLQGAEQGYLRYGCPQRFVLTLYFPDESPTVDIDLQWFQKPANRLPEAIWFSFAPHVKSPERWLLQKMGQLISPLDVVRDGNRKLHAVDQKLVYQDEHDKFVINTFDVPLVAPGEPSLLDFNNEQPDLRQGMHFNLYNNVWGTNFPMWYEEDGRFRFQIIV